MLKKITFIWNTLFAPKDWEIIGDAQTGEWVARRWLNGRWEYRAATQEEAENAYFMWAIR